MSPPIGFAVETSSGEEEEGPLTYTDDEGLALDGEVNSGSHPQAPIEAPAEEATATEPEVLEASVNVTVFEGIRRYPPIPPESRRVI